MTLISSRGGQGCNVGTFHTDAGKQIKKGAIKSGHGKERVAQSELG